MDQLREHTGKDTGQDIEALREGIVNELLTGVKIVDRNVDQVKGTCSSTAVMLKSNVTPTLPSSIGNGETGR